jgi:outer membrane protein assembly factor BamB
MNPTRRLICSLALGVAALAASTAAAIDWPEWFGENREGVWKETGLVDKFPEGGPKVTWRIPLGAGYSGPAVANGKVYITDRKNPDGQAKDVSDRVRSPGASPGSERILCLDAATGKQVWAHEYDCPYTFSYRAGPRTTPLVRDGRVYALGAEGDLVCLSADKGEVKWQKNVKKEYSADTPVWGYASSPLLDGDLLYCLVGGEGSAVVAFNKDTGKEVWKNLSTDEIGYAPPAMITAGGTRQLIIWLSEAIHGLDPATGKVFWKQDYPINADVQRPAVTIPTPKQDGDRLFISSYYHGPLMLKLASDRPAVEVVFKDKSKSPKRLVGLHSTMATPVLRGDYIYGICANGELKCCSAKNGDTVWETLAVIGGKKADCGTAFLVPQGDRYVIFNDSGELILANLTPKGYDEISRAKILDPVEGARGRVVVWSHPAFANRCVYARNHKEMVCVSLAKDQAGS